MVKEKTTIQKKERDKLIADVVFPLSENLQTSLPSI